MDDCALQTSEEQVRPHSLDHDTLDLGVPLRERLLSGVGATNDTLWHPHPVPGPYPPGASVIHSGARWIMQPPRRVAMERCGPLGDDAEMLERPPPPNLLGGPHQMLQTLRPL